MTVICTCYRAMFVCVDNNFKAHLFRLLASDPAQNGDVCIYICCIQKKANGCLISHYIIITRAVERLIILIALIARLIILIAR